MSTAFEAAWKAYGDNWPSDKPDFRRVWNAAIEAAAEMLEDTGKQPMAWNLAFAEAAKKVRALATEGK